MNISALIRKRSVFLSSGAGKLTKVWIGDIVWILLLFFLMSSPKDHLFHLQACLRKSRKFSFSTDYNWKMHANYAFLVVCITYWYKQMNFKGVVRANLSFSNVFCIEKNIFYIQNLKIEKLCSPPYDYRCCLYFENNLHLILWYLSRNRLFNFCLSGAKLYFL